MFRRRLRLFIRHNSFDQDRNIDPLSQPVNHIPVDRRTRDFHELLRTGSRLGAAERRPGGDADRFKSYVRRLIDLRAHRRQISHDPDSRYVADGGSIALSDMSRSVELRRGRSDSESGPALAVA